MKLKFKAGDLINITDNSCAMYRWLENRGASTVGLTIKQVDHDFMTIEDFPECPYGVFRNSIEIMGGPW